MGKGGQAFYSEDAGAANGAFSGIRGRETEAELVGGKGGGFTNLDLESLGLGWSQELERDSGNDNKNLGVLGQNNADLFVVQSKSRGLVTFEDKGELVSKWHDLFFKPQGTVGRNT